jgi:hypothetical protein
MTTTPRTLWLTIQVLAAALMVGAWALAALWLLGVVVNPAALTRSNFDGSASVPYQLGIVVALALIGLGGLRLTRSALRRRKAPQQTHAPRTTPARRAEPLTPAQRAEVRAQKRAQRRASGPSTRVSGLRSRRCYRAPKRSCRVMSGNGRVRNPRGSPAPAYS